MSIQVHVDDELAIAELAYSLYLKAQPGNPAWSALPESHRVKWRDLVPDYAKTVYQPSFSLMESSIKQAIRDFPPRPQFNPDAVISKIAGKEKR